MRALRPKTRRSATHVFATGLLVSSLFVTQGCYYSTRLIKEPVPAVLAAGGAVAPVPLVIESVAVTLNGTPTSVAVGFERDYIAGMRTLGYFSPVISSERADEAPKNAAHMTLSSVVVVDPHQGSAMVKGFFIGLSLYLLTPVLPLTHDVSQAVTATLTMPNGAVRRYEAAASGRGTYALGSNSVLMETELNSKVGTAALQGLLARIREDAVFRASR